MMLTVFLPLLLAFDPAISSAIPLSSTIALQSPSNSANSFPTNLTVIQPTNGGKSNRARFIDSVYAEVLHMAILYPGATFLEVQLTSVTGPTIDPTKLTDVRLIFGIQGEDDFYTIFVQNTPWGAWATPHVLAQRPPAQDGVLPSGLGMDILVADLLLKDAGYRQEYEAVDVRWPTNFPTAKQQVYYFFRMAGDAPSIVAVGARDRSIIAQNSAQDGWAWYR